MEPGQTLTDITVRALRAARPRAGRGSVPTPSVVQGDTTTSFAGALAAFYRQIPVVHVEAGLRTGDRYSPFPEEMNRQAHDPVSPTCTWRRRSTASTTSCDEGVDPARIVVTGNTVIDALLWAVAQRAPVRRRAARRARRRRCPACSSSPRTAGSHGARRWKRIGDAVARIATAAPRPHRRRARAHATRPCATRCCPRSPG